MEEKQRERYFPKPKAVVKIRIEPDNIHLRDPGGSSPFFIYKFGGKIASKKSDQKTNKNMDEASPKGDSEI